MRRHFVEHQDFEVFVATTADFCEPGIQTLKLNRAPWLQRLSNTRCVRLVRNFELLFYGTRLDRRVFDAAKEFRPDAVFTVADMTLCEQARKLAKRLGVPLVVNYQDWWPRGQFYYSHEKPYFWVRAILEWRFRRLYREADLAFCTSEGMKEFLGPHPNAHVLYPIGAGDKNLIESRGSRDESKEEKAKTDLTTDFTDGHGWGTTKYTNFHESVKQGDAGRSTLDATAAKCRKKRLIYTGTAFGSYGKMLRELARELEKQEDWKLVIFGNTPDWPKEELERAKDTALYRGLLKFEELQRELNESDACLAVMSFEPELEVMIRTSFTTKMLDYCRVGKPLILWGPEYCSPIRLALKHNAALVNLTNDATIITNKLVQLLMRPALADELSKAAMGLSQGELDHKSIHNILKNQVHKLMKSHIKKDENH
jgi:glycosyltransferase involved in cell wall biosynthesis